MPAMKDVANTLRLDIGFTLNGVPSGTRMFFTYDNTAAPTTSFCNAVNASAKSVLASTFKPLWHTSTSVVMIKTTDLSSHTAAYAQDNSTTPGSAAGSAAPANAAVQINYLINNRYRGGKPRGFWPGGLVTQFQDAQHWQSSFVTSYQTAINNLIVAVIATVGPPTITGQCAVHYFKGHVANPNPTTWSAVNVPAPLAIPTTDRVVTPLVMSLIGSQRGRLRT